ncbi:hypothetical protein [Croceicoccus marinus]|uniref:Uncharacterized protein n=1 Tax=Croceicoccus marinus TaxID=450378 RepID=A0A7G6W198_9SPHN|nr:hypothetical protein [Croceicoccus marinus]QNE07763.1 hypothetical protein H4O24_19645 [Croceicoccus marinus]
MSDWSSTDPHSTNFVDTQSIHDRSAPLSYNPSNMYDPTTPLGYLRYIEERERVQSIGEDLPALAGPTPLKMCDIALMLVFGILGAIVLSIVF